MPLGADPDGAGPATAFGIDSFDTVQHGVDCVAPFGFVDVRAGTYLESVEIPKAVTVRGAGADSITIVAESRDGITVLASSVTLEDFTVRVNEEEAVGIRAGIGSDAASAVSQLVIRRVVSMSNEQAAFDGNLTGRAQFENSQFNSRFGTHIAISGRNGQFFFTGASVGPGGGNGLVVFGNDNVKVSITDGSYERTNGFGIALGGVSQVSVGGSPNINENQLTGLRISGARTVDITGGLFNNNLVGISLTDVDRIRIDDIAANGNINAGLEVCGFAGSRSQSVHVSNSNFLDGPTGDSVGLQIQRAGLAVISKVTATGRELGGLQITDATLVRITGGSYSDNQGGPDADGIQLTNIAVARLIDVTAEVNGDDGLDARTISILNVQGGQYNNNGGFGIERNNILVKSILKGVTTDGNGAGGVSGVD